VTEGQALELGDGRTDAVPRRIAAEDLDRAIQFATIYWKARPGNPKRLAQLGARLKLDLAFGLYGDKLNPVFDALTAYAPVEYRRGSEASLRDWGHFTDFLHHKLLLADDRVIVLGGRNVENAYHMRQNPEVQGYVFRDTDLYLRAEDGSLGLAASFGKLWNFRTMVATLEDVRLHAPNDVLVATRQANAACAKLAVDPEQESTCQASLRASGIDLQTRLDQAYQHMVENEAAFRERYIPAEANQRNKTFTIDGGAAAYYLENLPFAHDTPAPAIERLYGAKNGREGESGKHIHEVWLAAMRKSCADASPENSKEVIFHSAYFFPPSNLLRQMADMVDGTLDCSNVTLKVLTNSPGTTDLNIINLFALPWLSAFGDYYNTERDPARGARFAYYEYLPEWLPDHRPAFSLHSKVMVFGDEVYVGSANTDVRSYMMDTNNGFYVRQAPEFAADYRRWLKEQLSDPGLVEDKTEIVLNATPEQIRAQEQEALQKMIDGIIGGTSLEHRLPTEHVLERLLGVLDHVHDLTAEILREDTAESDAVRQFNALYRLI
jgi:phosphatidylserine/phosphatidylglycerophosphate/cardiolipin synthase-like enzyme